MRTYQVIDSKGESHEYNANSHLIEDDGAISLFFNSRNSFLVIKHWVEAYFENLSEENKKPEKIVNPLKSNVNSNYRIYQS